MSKIKIFGSTASRAYRALWLAKELGIEYEQVVVSMADLKKPEFLAVNPNAKMPAMQDGDLCLFESMAINLYLAHKFDKGLWPKSMADEGRTYQWSFWVMTEVEKPLLTVLMDAIGMKKDPDGAAAARKSLEGPFGVLDRALAGRDHLLGKDFSVADLNVASVMSWAKASKLDFTPWPNLKAWLDRCMARPAAVAARK